MKFLLFKVVDVFKFDIEGPEWDFLANLDVDYACQYFKQIMFETHMRGPNGEMNFDLDKFNPDWNLKNFKTIQRLERCFLLFHRDTRFFVPGKLYSTNLGCLTEFQMDEKVLIRRYGRNEIEATLYMFSTGELYFVNRNFL